MLDIDMVVQQGVAERDAGLGVDDGAVGAVGWGGEG